MFTKIFGENPQTKLLNFLADHPDHDYTIADLVKKTGVSKPTIYKILPKLLKENLVVVTRKVGKAKLYKLNTENELVKLILKFEFELANLLKERPSDSLSTAETVELLHEMYVDINNYRGGKTLKELVDEANDPSRWRKSKELEKGLRGLKNGRN